MSVVLRYLCATLILLVAIHCSQEFSIGYGPEIENDNPSPLQIGRSTLEDNESVSEEDDFISSNEKRSLFKRKPYISLGKRVTGYEYMPQSAFSGDKTFLRIGRNPSDSTFLRIGRAPNDRTFLRFGRPSDRTFLRIGRAPSQTFLRIGRAPGEKRFLRIGRSGTTFLRIGRPNEMQNDGLFAEDTEDLDSGANDDTNNDYDMEKRYGSGLRIGKRTLRIGKRQQLRIGKRLLKNPQNVQSMLTPEEIQLILENKELLLKLLEMYPDLMEDDVSPRM